MLTDCSVKCLGACTRRALGDARRCQRVSQRWNRYHPYFIPGGRRPGSRAPPQRAPPPPPGLAPLRRRATSSGPAPSSPVEAGLRSTAVTALVALPRALLKESGGDLADGAARRPLADHAREGAGRGWGRGGRRGEGRGLRRGRAGWLAGWLAGRGLGHAGLDSVKLRQVICDFNKAEGLGGISCLGDGGRRRMEMYSWPGGPRARLGPLGRPPRARQRCAPRALNAKGVSGPQTRVCARVRVCTHTLHGRVTRHMLAF